MGSVIADMYGVQLGGVTRTSEKESMQKLKAPRDSAGGSTDTGSGTNVGAS
jgi:hypothetical protein